jgi:hypothetical protein
LRSKTTSFCHPERSEGSIRILYQALGTPVAGLIDPSLRSG